MKTKLFFIIISIIVTISVMLYCVEKKRNNELILHIQELKKKNTDIISKNKKLEKENYNLNKIVHQKKITLDKLVQTYNVAIDFVEAYKDSDKTKFSKLINIKSDFIYDIKNDNKMKFSKSNYEYSLNGYSYEDNYMTYSFTLYDSSNRDIPSGNLFFKLKEYNNNSWKVEYIEVWA